MLAPSRWVEDQYWEHVEDKRGVPLGGPSSGRGECAIRVASVAHMAFQAVHALFFSVPIAMFAVGSFCQKYRERFIPFDALELVAVEALSILWLPVLHSLSVAMAPSVLDTPIGAELRRVPNRLASDLLFRTTLGSIEQ
jgi:hypothetical protein